MDPKKRINVKAGLKVNIVLKADQRTNKLTQGIVKDILTNSPSPDFRKSTTNTHNKL